MGGGILLYETLTHPSTIQMPVYKSLVLAVHVSRGCLSATSDAVPHGMHHKGHPGSAGMMMIIIYIVLDHLLLCRESIRDIISR